MLCRVIGRLVFLPSPLASFRPDVGTHCDAGAVPQQDFFETYAGFFLDCDARWHRVINRCSCLQGLAMTEELSHLLEDARKIESAWNTSVLPRHALETDIKSATEFAGKLVKALDNAKMSAKQEAAWGADNGD